ncbi:hypothetical protein [Mycoplasma yeatsii]|uniref:hypothetical protein n=1 Tax=Mycoplasma yeatsii TaxID=51365 RepID=UPI0005B23F6D|nr:hypothetical protein [Mycoplasma yeatsii]AJM71747.1 hypothetical protein MYE_01325 [Mycoplasma yeatsii GM274B]
MLISNEEKNIILEKVKGSRIRMVAICFDAYKKRFDQIYKNHEKISYYPEGKRMKVFNENNEYVDNFNSDSAFEQCFKTLVGLGFLDINLNGDYIPILQERSVEEIIDLIFSKYDKGNNQYYKDWINIYRQSKIISFLIELKIIDENNVNSLQLKKLKKTSEFDINKFKQYEIGRWEKEICLSEKTKNYIISKVLGHDFIK